MAPNCGNPFQTGPEAVEKVSNRAYSFYHTDQASPQIQASAQNRNLSSNEDGDSLRLEAAEAAPTAPPTTPNGGTKAWLHVPIPQLMATGEKKPCQNNLPRRLLTSISSRGIINAFGVNPPSTISSIS